MEKIEIRAIYRDTEPIFTDRFVVTNGLVIMSRSSYRRYCNRLCYAGTDGIRARSCVDGRRLIVAVDQGNGPVPVTF